MPITLPKPVVVALLIGFVVNSIAIRQALGEGPPSPADEADRTYLTANGLLNRGLNELAVDEYREYLKSHEDSEKAPRARYGLSVALFRLKKFDEALVQLTKLESDSGFEFATEVAVMKGQCHLVTGQFAEAAKAFRHVKSDSHDLADDAAAGLVEALYRDGKHNQVGEEAERFASRFGDSPLRDRVELFAGLSEMAESKFADAATRFAAFVKAYPKSGHFAQVSLLLAQSYQQSNQTAKAIDQYREVLGQRGTPYMAEALLGVGILLHQEGEDQGASEALDQLIKRFPDVAFFGRALFYRAQVAFAQSEYDTAFAAFERAGEADKTLADQCAYWMAKCRLRQGKSEEAASALASAVENFGDTNLRAEMLYDRAIALLRSEKEDEAIDVLKTFRREFPNHSSIPDVLHLLAATEHQRGNFDRSKEYCEAFLAEHADHELTPSVLFLLAENEFLTRSYENAVKRYREFLSRNGDDAQADKARFRLGIALYRLDDFDGALPLLEQLEAQAKKDAVFAPALVTLGDIHFQRGEWKAAEDYLTKYLSSSPDAEVRDDALFKLAYAQQRQEEHADAIRTYERLIEEFPESPHRLQALFERGQVLVAEKRTEDAAEAFKQVLSEGGNDSRFASFALNHLAAIASQSGDSEAAAKYYAKAAKSFEGDDAQAQALLRQAQSLIAAEEFSNAEWVLHQLLRDHPDFEQRSEAQARLAIVLARLERCDDALALMDKLANQSKALEPKLRSSLLYDRAWCLRATGREEEAAKVYGDLLRDTSDDELSTHVMLELAELKMKAEAYGEAAEILRQLQDRLDKLPSEYGPAIREQCAYQLAASLFELGEYAKAGEPFEQFIGRFPKSDLVASASYLAGESFFQSGRFEKAVANFARVDKNHESSDVIGPSLLRLGESQAALQRWAASEKAFCKYLERFADNEAWFQAQFGMGWAQQNQKRYDDAIASYKKVVDRHQGPTAARAQFQIGQCKFAQNEYDDAAKELLKVDILYAYPEWSAAALYEAARCFERMNKPMEAREHFRRVTEKYRDSDWAKLAKGRLSELSSSAALPGR